MTAEPDLAIVEESPASLVEYARIPIAFEVRAIITFDPPDDISGRGRLVETPLAVPYLKDYDALRGNHPSEWPERFDMSRWGVLGAWTARRRVGGAVIAWATPGLDILEGRDDLAVLWDLRVAPDARRRGIGAVLFAAAERWAAERGARWLKIETQNINVPACRFYARQGCSLGSVHRFAYPTLPDEVQLLWYKELEPRAGAQPRT